MQSPTVNQSTATDRRGPVALTDRGRIRAVLAALETRWDGLSEPQRAEARELVERLAATCRRPRTPRVLLLGRRGA